VKIKCQVFKNKKRNEWQKKAFQTEKINSELKEKGHEPSQAKLKIPQLELWLEPARLGLITNKQALCNSQTQHSSFNLP
jgi:hypothetical protein